MARADRARDVAVAGQGVQHDVSVAIPVEGAVDGIVHMASPASVPDYLGRPIETLDVGSLGTRNGLELAKVGLGWLARTDNALSGPG